MHLDDISVKFTEQTLDGIICKAGGTKYTSFKFGKEFNKGDSYLSKVFRLAVEGINELNGTSVKVNLIVKAMPDNLARRKLFRSTDFFQNEINFYTKVLPALEAFQKQRQAKDPFNEYPRHYASHCDGENDFIAIEDVSIYGFKAPMRQDYISLSECILTMKTLGRFHAVSLVFNAVDPDKFNAVSKYLEETYYSENNRDWYKEFLNLACSVAQDAVSKTFPQSKYETITKNFLDATLYDDMINLVSAKSKLRAVSHGDCWTPNFLTRFIQNSNPDAIKIIDFQLARCASVALDISFFIYSCTSEQLRQNHFEEILKAYHESACHLISDLGGNPNVILPYNVLLEELKEFGRFGCGMGIESLPMSLIDDEEVADLDKIELNAKLTDVWNIKPFIDSRKRERIADIFKHAIDNGFIK